MILELFIKLRMLSLGQIEDKIQNLKQKPKCRKIIGDETSFCTNLSSFKKNFFWGKGERCLGVVYNFYFLLEVWGVSTNSFFLGFWRVSTSWSFIVFGGLRVLGKLGWVQVHLFSFFRIEGAQQASTTLQKP